MRVSVIGLGKLGLCTAACFASKGHRVAAFDTNKALAGELRARRCPIRETGLAELLSKSWDNLTVVDSAVDAVLASDITAIIVPTPSLPSGEFTNKHVDAVLAELAPALLKKNAFHVIDVVSTVMPGSSDKHFVPMIERFTGLKCGTDFGFVYNPEFIALGSVVRNFLNPDMVLIGASDATSGALARELYAGTCDSSPHIAVMSLINAEIAKISLNCYVTTKISFANQLAAICELVPNADVDEITAAIGADSRVGPKYLKGGLGFGGPCFPRDNIAFQRFAEQAGYPAHLGEQVVAINKSVVDRLAATITAETPRRGSVLLLGMSYKPDTHITEESQSVMLARQLAADGYKCTVHDPQAIDEVKASLHNTVKYAEDVNSALAGVDAVVLMTDWPEYRKIDWTRAALLVNPNALLIDSWRILKSVEISGFRYRAIGMGPLQADAPRNNPNDNGRMMNCSGSDTNGVTKAALWTHAPSSLQEILHSSELQSLKAAGFGTGTLYVLFPTNAHYSDPASGVKVVCRNNERSLANHLCESLADNAILVPVVEGVQYAEGMMLHIATATAKQPSDILSYAVSINSSSHSHKIENRVAPWNTAFMGGYVKGHAADVISFMNHYADMPDLYSAQTAHISDCLAQITSPIVEREYRVYAEADITLSEIGSGIRDSKYLLRAYIARAVAADRPQLVNSLPYDLLKSAGTVPSCDCLSFGKLNAMEGLLAKGRWSDLIATATSHLSGADDPNLATRSQLARGVGYANTNQPERASADFMNSLSKDPSSLAGKFVVGQYMLYIGQFRDAVACFKQCTEKDRFDEDASDSLAYAFYRLGDYAHALSVLSHSMATFDFDQNRLRFTLHVAAMDDNMEALHKYSRYIEPYPPLPANFPEKEWGLLYELLRNGDSNKWVIDVGANTGDMSEAILRWGHRCLSIEPDTDLLPDLQQRLSGFGDRSVIERCACSSEDGTASLRVGLERGFNTLDTEVQTALAFRYHDEPQYRDVQTRRLAALLRKHSVECVSLLKIDTEGYELEVLKGLDEAWFNRIGSVFFEIDLRMPHKGQAVANYLGQHGFEHGLIFQHPNNDLPSFRIARLAPGKDTSIDPSNGVYANVLLSREPIFAIDHSQFVSTSVAIPPERIHGRLFR